MADLHTSDVRTAQLGRSAFLAAALLVCAVLIWVNLDKALWTGIQGWGRPYWWLDYHHGFVRRGLVGEIFQLLAGRRTEQDLIAPVDLIHRICIGGLVAGALYALFRALREQPAWGRSSLVAAVALWLAVSEFWPTVAYNQGYMDALVLCVALAAALLVRARVYWAAGVLLFVGPFIHEYFVFLVPFVLASERLRPEPGEAAEPGDVIVGYHEDERETVKVELRHLYALAAVAVVAAAIVTFLPARDASALEIANMPMSAADRRILLDTTLTQTLSTSLRQCVGLFLSDLGFTLPNAMFFLAPGLICVTALLFWRGLPIRPALWIRAVAGLFPVAALALAWDFSRLLVMADFTAGLLFLMTARDLASATSRDVGGRAAGAAAVAMTAAAALAVLALGYVTLPMAYVYYPPGPATLFPLKTWPAEGRRTFGFAHMWANAHVSATLPRSLPSNLKRPGPQLIHDLHGGEGVVQAAHGAWAVPAAGERLILFGPYIDLHPGRYRVRLHLRETSTGGACPPPPSVGLSVSADVGKTVVAPQHSLVVSAAGDCRSQAVGEFMISKDVKEAETPIFAASAQPFVVDGYTLERTGDPVAAQSR